MLRSKSSTTARALFVALFLLIPTAVVAQDKPAPLTELETLKVELASSLRENRRLLEALAALRLQLAQALVQVAQTERSAAASSPAERYATQVQAELEDARPGFTFNPQTRTFEKKAP